jgi:hypothetical protein
MIQTLNHNTIRELNYNKIRSFNLNTIRTLKNIIIRLLNYLNSSLSPYYLNNTQHFILDISYSYHKNTERLMVLEIMSNIHSGEMLGLLTLNKGLHMLKINLMTDMFIK